MLALCLFLFLNYFLKVFLSSASLVSWALRRSGAICCDNTPQHVWRIEEEGAGQEDGGPEALARLPLILEKCENPVSKALST
jgi:hypothetical protein